MRAWLIAVLSSGSVNRIMGYSIIFTVLIRRPFLFAHGRYFGGFLWALPALVSVGCSVLASAKDLTNHCPHNTEHCFNEYLTWH